MSLEGEILAIRDEAKALLLAETPLEVLHLYLKILQHLFQPSALEISFYQALSRDGPFRLFLTAQGEVSEEEAVDLPVDFASQDILQQEEKSVSFPAGEGLEIWLPLAHSGEFLGITRLVLSDAGGMTSLVSGHVQFASMMAGAAVQLLQKSQSLKVARRRMAHLVEAVNVGVVSFEKSRRLLHVNRNAVMMLQMQGAKEGVLLEETFNPQTLVFIQDMLREYTEQGFVMDRQLSLEIEGSGELAVGVNLASWVSEDEDTGFVLTLRDMTASQELDRLRRLDQMKSDFVNNVSHELRTPLTSIKAYTEALQGMLEDETQQNFLKVVAEESDRLLGMIENLLNVSRIESGKMTLHRAPMKLMDILRRVKEITAVQSEKHQIVLDDADLPEMDLDADKMTEVFLNIISNAIKYSPEGGEVRMNPTIKDGNVEIAISDQGIGLSEEDCQRVFEQFYRVDSTATATIGGTGLGLAITQSIVGAHGGVIRVTSKLGVGSTFTVVLPLDSQGGVDEIQLMPGSSPFG